MVVSSTGPPFSGLISHSISGTFSGSFSSSSQAVMKPRDLKGRTRSQSRPVMLSGTGRSGNRLRSNSDKGEASSDCNSEEPNSRENNEEAKEGGNREGGETGAEAGSGKKPKEYLSRPSSTPPATRAPFRETLLWRNLSSSNLPKMISPLPVSHNIVEAEEDRVPEETKEGRREKGKEKMKGRGKKDTKRERRRKGETKERGEKIEGKGTTGRGEPQKLDGNSKNLSKWMEGSGFTPKRKEKSKEKQPKEKPKEEKKPSERGKEKRTAFTVARRPKHARYDILPGTLRTASGCIGAARVPSPPGTCSLKSNDVDCDPEFQTPTRSRKGGEEKGEGSGHVLVSPGEEPKLKLVQSLALSSLNTFECVFKSEGGVTTRGVFYIGEETYSCSFPQGPSRKADLLTRYFSEILSLGFDESQTSIWIRLPDSELDHICELGKEFKFILSLLLHLWRYSINVRFDGLYLSNGGKEEHYCGGGERSSSRSILTRSNEKAVVSPRGADTESGGGNWGAHLEKGPPLRERSELLKQLFQKNICSVFTLPPDEQVCK